jgi:hypothetical protein
MRYQDALCLEKLRGQAEETQQNLTPLHKKVNTYYSASKVWYDPIGLSIQRITSLNPELKNVRSGGLKLHAMKSLNL